MGKTETQDSKANSWEVYFLPAALLLFSIVSVPGMNDPASLPRQLIWISALLGWWVFRLWKERKKPAPADVGIPRSLSIVFAVSLLATAISLFQASELSEGLLSFQRQACGVAGFFLLLKQIRSSGSNSKTIWITSIWATGALQTMIALGAYALQKGAHFPPEGTQMNPNILGTLVALCLPAGIWLAFQRKDLLGRFALVSLPISIFVIYLSVSRSALLILLVYALFLFVLGLLRVRDLQGNGRRRALLLAGLVLLVVVAASALYRGWGRKEMPSSYSQLFNAQSSISRNTNSLETRLVLWNKSLQMGISKPLSGVGAGNWKLEAPCYGIKGFDANGNYGLLHYTHPHNEFMLAFAEAGVLGLLGYMAFFAVIFALAWKAARNPSPGIDQSVIWVAVAGLLAYCVDASFAFPGERLEASVILALFAGLIVSEGRDSKVWNPSPVMRKALNVLGLASLLASALLVMIRIPNDHAVLRMRKAKESKQWAQVEIEARSAESWWYKYEGQSAAPLAWYQAMAMVEQARSQAGSTGNPMSVPAYAERMRNALGQTDRALSLSPCNLAALNERASTLALMGRHAEAADAYRSLLAIFPDHEEAWINLAVCHFNLQQSEPAQEALSHVKFSTQHPTYQALQGALGSKK